MATTKTGICNLALIQVQHTQFIQDIETEDSPEADVCNEVYDQCRDETLALAPWPFASRRWKPAALAAAGLDGGAVPTGWQYAYPSPPDRIKTRGIWTGRRNPATRDEIPLDEGYDSQLQAVILLTDQPTPEFIYTARIEQVSLYSPSFVRAVAQRIAVDLALGIKKDPELAKSLFGAWELAAGAATQAALDGVQPDHDPRPDHLRARG